MPPSPRPQATRRAWRRNRRLLYAALLLFIAWQLVRVYRAWQAMHPAPVVRGVLA